MYLETFVLRVMEMAQARRRRKRKEKGTAQRRGGA
jgi:hypothetical protein